MSTKSRVLQKNDSDVVIVVAVRTAITKAKKGGFKDTPPELLLSHVLRAAYAQSGLDPVLIEDISVGQVLPPGNGANGVRMAAIHAGIPISTPINTVNRQCSSGLTAVNQIANQIAVGQIDIGIGAGVESMTQGYGPQSMPPEYAEEILANPVAEDCLLPMGITSENVAADFNIARFDQDAFAALSFQRASSAFKAGKFRNEILPVRTKATDPKSGKTLEIVVDHDDGVREGVTAEGLAKLKPAFSDAGSTHAGNASQVSDGAAAVLLARRSTAKKLRLPIVGKFVAAAAVGVPPRIMGIGPAVAIPKVLDKTGLSKSDIDFYEINEAFASQAIYCIRQLEIPMDKVNIHGGAIAIGHPLGCTGARQIATGLNIAKQYGARVFVTSMCVGSGMGMAAVFVNEQ
ncbi:putative thiolase family protein [Lyophyllum shimeji]|uniref:Thiolase family protein n=1 Tax=Lyophyllum shimeji TaxID=47721 RepID=A0A9P3PXZ9_LYOSH|nr:putative thiolase family protein [Lyophyllum shimeji]